MKSLFSVIIFATHLLPLSAADMARGASYERLVDASPTKIFQVGALLGQFFPDGCKPSSQQGQSEEAAGTLDEETPQIPPILVSEQGNPTERGAQITFIEKYEDGRMCQLGFIRGSIQKVSADRQGQVTVSFLENGIQCGWRKCGCISLAGKVFYRILPGGKVEFLGRK